MLLPTARSQAPIAAKRPMVVVTDRGEAKVVIRHLRFAVDRAVADNDVLRERAVKEYLPRGVAQLEAEGWRYVRPVLDTDDLPGSLRREFPAKGDTGTPLCKILPHVEFSDAQYVDPGLPQIPPPPRGAGVTEAQIEGYRRELAVVEAAQRAYQARDYAADVRDLVDIRVYAKFVAPLDVIVRSLSASLLGSKR